MQKATVSELSIADTSGQDIAIEPESKRKQYLISGIAATVALIVIVVLVMPFVLRWSEADDSVARDRLRTSMVTRGDLVRDVSVQGRVVAAVSPTLYAPQSGTITFLVEAGDSVLMGDVLAVIDSPGLANTLKQEQANYARLQVEIERQGIETKQKKLENRKTADLAEVALTASDREARRADGAYGKGAISQLDYEKAHDEKRSSEVAYAHAVADAELDSERLDFELKTRQLELEGQGLLVEDLIREVDELSIRSPVGGVVGNLLVEQKTSVSLNVPVLAVVDLSRFEVEAQVPESYSDDLAVGMAAEVRTGTTLTNATLVAISPEIIANQVTVRLRFDSDMPAGLRQNQRLTTRVLFEAKADVMRVARGQFLESGGGRIAYVIEDGIARRRTIEVGARSLNAVEIVSGLAVGDEIIVSSLETFAGKEALLITD